MIRLLTVIGARPQFIKASSISKAILDQFSDKLNEDILHTGQHYDDNMSKVFFDELNIPKPRFHLTIESGNGDEQLSEMIVQISKIINEIDYDAVLVYGDTTSTLAGALAAARNNIRLIHVEAGLRSFNRRMPEELNRILSDHCSTLLFSPTDTGIENLKKEGILNDPDEKVSADNPQVFRTGDIMLDSSLNFRDVIKNKEDEYRRRFPVDEEFVLCTVHRGFNVDYPEKLLMILNAFEKIGVKFGFNMILPLHPRTKNNIQTEEFESSRRVIESSQHIKIIDPVSYPEMLFLENFSEMIITDSGGVQKEAYFFNKKCLVLRPETEWVEIMEQGTAVLAHHNTYEIVEKFSWLYDVKELDFPPLFGDGKSAYYIAKQIVQSLND